MTKTSKGFTCPTCGTPMGVVKTVATANGVIKRRRACATCAYRCTTEERRKGALIPPGHYCPPASTN